MDLLDFIESDRSDEQSIKLLIKRRRLQMLVHSCIYYELNDNVWTDHQWQEKADELQQLQHDYPHLKQIDCWDWEFRDWDGSTGAHLPHRHPWVYAKANYILELAQNDATRNLRT